MTDIRLSQNFTLRELSHSQAAARAHLDNTPPPPVIENLRRVAETLLQPVRDFLQKPVSVTSGYRSPAVNELIGGSRSSAHMTGLAVDSECFALSTLEYACVFERLHLPFDQLILEFHHKDNKNSGWVHAALAPAGQTPRGDVFFINAETIAAKRNGDLPSAYVRLNPGDLQTMLVYSHAD